MRETTIYRWKNPRLPARRPLHPASRGVIGGLVGILAILSLLAMLELPYGVTTRLVGQLLLLPVVTLFMSARLRAGSLGLWFCMSGFYGFARMITGRAPWSGLAALLFLAYFALSVLVLRHGLRLAAADRARETQHAAAGQ